MQFRISNFEFRILPGLAAALSGVFLFAAFPPLDWTPVAWIALVPLLIVCPRLSCRSALGWGFFSGLVFWCMSMAWLTRVSWAGCLLLSAYCALYTGLFAAGTCWWMRRLGIHPRCGNPGLLFLIPAFWVGLEFIRATFLSGFPWNPLGVSQYRNLAIIQCAQWGGVYAVSYLVALMNVALALTLIHYARDPGRARTRPHLELMACAVLIGACFFYGRGALRDYAGAEGNFKLALVQVNLPQYEKWAEEWNPEIEARLRQTTLAALKATRPDLIVWPETVVQDFVRSSLSSRKLVEDLLREGVPILMGSMDFEETAAGCRYFNSALLFTPADGLAQTYNKRHLVLFGEYIPLERYVPFLRQFTPITESFVPGATSTVFQVGATPFSVLICFEDTIAWLARESVRNGARLLINQTNDAWFDPSAASRQQMAHAVFRCVENRVPMARATNTGITCFIDRAGRIYGRLPPGPGILAPPEYVGRTLYAPPKDMPLTLYTRCGDILGWACVAFALALLGSMAILRRRGGADRGHCAQGQ